MILPGKSVTVTHWRIVSNGTDEIAASYDSYRDGRWGITKANEWLETCGPNNYHIEVWEETYHVTDSEWQRIE